METFGCYIDDIEIEVVAGGLYYKNETEGVELFGDNLPSGLVQELSTKLRDFIHKELIDSLKGL
jgi:hypothetical protein